MSFFKLGLGQSITQAIQELGYDTPTPIQAQSIPILINGSDIIAQAQTGTGKTAAFALPILHRLDLKVKKPQALIMAPTRELAIQVAEALKSYAKYIKDFHVAPIFGGQDYNIQLRALKRNPQVIVGTPGRLMDHLRRGTLEIDQLKTVVLDEADEMLKMGFIDDIEWILEQVTTKHQTALFSATMPAPIQKIANRYLVEPEKIFVKPQKESLGKIKQFYTRTPQREKVDLLLRFLEVENVDAAIVFTRTKNLSSDVAEKLQAAGYSAAALNGDMQQNARKKVLDRIKNGELNIIVATDVAARGIDVERVTHVFNYDISMDVESYIHRIGRTGRAGREGRAFLFVTPSESRLLRAIEVETNKAIEQIEPPSVEVLLERRNSEMMNKIAGVITKSKRLGSYQSTISQLIKSHGFAAEDIAAALLYLMQQDNPVVELTGVGSEQKSSSSKDKKPARRGKKGFAKKGKGERQSNSQGHRPRTRSAPKKAKRAR